MLNSESKYSILLFYKIIIIVKAKLYQKGNKMITFKTIKQKEYKNYDNRYSKDVNTVCNWLSDIIGDNGLFFSMRWYNGKTLSKTKLISKIHIIFNQVFQELLKTHWFKLYEKHFNFVIVEEFGKKGRHAHIALGIKSDKFTSDDVINALVKLEPRIKIQVSTKEGKKKIRLTKKHHNDMVISKIYDVNGVSEYISKEFTVCFDHNRHFVNTNNFIFLDEVFPKKSEIILSPEVKKSNAEIIKKTKPRTKLIRIQSI
ncbi:MAG: hypothetical protein ACK5N8_05915 [Alphaproteobacteria bacterium]